MDVQIEGTGVEIETPRLLLRAWKQEDIGDFYEYASVEGVGEMAGWKHHYSIEISQSILRSFMAEKNVFAIEYKENSKVIGSFGLHYSWANDDPLYKDLKQKEIGYVLSKDYWGRGLMPEAVTAVISHCFDEWGLEAVTVSHFSHNRQSKRVIEKCGFQFVKESGFYAKQLEQEFVNRQYIRLR